MADWDLYGGASDFRHHKNCDIRVTASSYDMTGKMNGQISLNRGTMNFNVSGTWSAQGAVTGRTSSSIVLSGSSSDDAPYFVTLIGAFDGVDIPNAQIDVMITVVSTNGQSPPTEPENWSTDGNNAWIKYFIGRLTGTNAVSQPW